MAKATKTSLAPPVVEPPYKLTLELSQKESEVLMAVLAKIGGSPLTSARGHMERIFNELDKVGVQQYSREHFVKDSSGYTPSLYFADDPGVMDK